jgi:hypothetical protein
MKSVSLNQLMKLKIPSVGLPAIIKPKPSALIPYVKKAEPPKPSICDANSCMWQPSPDPLAIAALEEYDATPTVNLNSEGSCRDQWMPQKK